MFTIFLLALPFLDDLSTLELQLAARESERSKMQEAITETDKKISDLKGRILTEKLKGTPFVESKTMLSGNLYKTSNVYIDGDKLLTFQGGTPVNVLDYDSLHELFQISIGESVGYTMNVNLVHTPEMAEMKNRAVKERQQFYQTLRDKEAAQEQAAAKKRAVERAQRLKEKEARVTRLYGPVMGRLIMARKVVIGMKKEQVVESLGRPEDINRTVLPGQVTEQWVYGGLYVYFTDGIVTSFQD